MKRRTSRTIGSVLSLLLISAIGVVGYKFWPQIKDFSVKSWNYLSEKFETRYNDAYDKISIGSNAYKELLAKYNSIEVEYVELNKTHNSQVISFNNTIAALKSSLEQQYNEQIASLLESQEQQLTELTNKYEEQISSMDNNAIDMAKQLLEIGVTDIVIPEGVTSIRPYAFSMDGLSGGLRIYLKSIIFPSTLKIIGKSAFARQIELTSIIIPSSVTVIEVDAFSNCSKLVQATFENKENNINKINEIYGSSSIFLNCPVIITMDRVFVHNGRPWGYSQKDYDKGLVFFSSLKVIYNYQNSPIFKFHKFFSQNELFNYPTGVTNDFSCLSNKTHILKWYKSIDDLNANINSYSIGDSVSDTGEYYSAFLPVL